MIDLRERLRGRRALLLAGDLACFVAFALLGLRSHEDGITLGGVVRAATPFQAGWLLVNLLLPKPAEGSDARGVVRAWVPAWAMGLVLRTLLFDRTLAVSFAVVALIVNAVLLMAWRGVASLLLPDGGDGRR